MIVTNKWEDKTTLNKAAGNAIKPSCAKLCSPDFVCPVVVVFIV
jgi:hypothetical protein